MEDCGELSWRAALRMRNSVGVNSSEEGIGDILSQNCSPSVGIKHLQHIKEIYVYCVFNMHGSTRFDPLPKNAKGIVLE